MKRLIKTLAAGLIISLLGANAYAAFVPRTIAELRQDYPDLPAGFDDKKLFEVVLQDTASKFERDFNLHPGWSGDEYAQAYARKQLRLVRLYFDMGTGFTRDQLVESNTAKMVERFLTNHHLPKDFSQAALIYSEGLKGAVSEGYTGQTEPLPAKEFEKQAGQAIDEDYVTKWHLSDHWDIEELRATVGPERAAQLSRLHNIRAGMTHAEIVEQLGKSETARYAKRFHISADFTADEAVQAAGWEELDFLRAGFDTRDQGEFNADWLIRQFRAEVLANIQKSYPGLEGNFTENQLCDLLAKQADRDMRWTYGFEGHYEEDDVARAAAESLVAEIRIKYKLPLHFTEEQLNAAM